METPTTEKLMGGTSTSLMDRSGLTCTRASPSDASCDACAETETPGSSGADMALMRAVVAASAIILPVVSVLSAAGVASRKSPDGMWIGASLLLLSRRPASGDPARLGSAVGS